MECQEAIDIDVFADELFKKQFCYDNYSSGCWSLHTSSSNVEDISTELNLLSALKETLNSVKSSLNDYDIIEWSCHTNFTNPSAKILPTLRKSIHPELATQAWCKFYELLSYANVVPQNTNSLNSVHLCEAPGGFICALNHYLNSFSNAVSHHWVANSLNPYYEGNALDSCIVDDRLISRTLRSWFFGKDNTGDVFQTDFVSALCRKCHKSFHSEKIDLVTADGSLNCQDDPSEQETIVAPLHYTELLCALSVLSTHGNFVIKMFTLFEAHSVTLMYILSCVFRKVLVAKPATSKAGNSEVYVVAQDYCGKKYCTDLISSLKKHLPFKSFIRNRTELIPNLTIPKSFLKQHVACVRLFSEHQISTIKRNIFLFRKVDEPFKDEITRLQECTTQKFFDICNLKKVLAKKCIVQSGILRANVKSNLKARPKLEGSFTQRKESDTDVETQAKNCDSSNNWLKVKPVWIPLAGKNFWWDTSQAIVGKQVSAIHSSLFCSTDMVVHYEHVFDQYKQKEVQLLSKDPENSICNIALLEELSCLISNLNGNFVSVLQQNVDTFHSNWIQNLVKQSNPHLANIDVFLHNPISDIKIPENAELICSNFVLSCDNQLKWPELAVRFDLIKFVYVTVTCLRKGGACIFVLPSSLMRITAQILWVFSQCFSESLLHPVKSSDSYSHPAILFVGKKFSVPPTYIPHFKHLCDLVPMQGRELLELFPITALLHTDKASSFISALKAANETCLAEAAVSINYKLSAK